MKIVRRLWIVLGAALACGACSTTPPPVSAHNLERPSDIAFACVGLFTPSADGGAITDAGAPVVNVVSGRPMYECNNPGSFDPPFDITRRTFGFVANSARGELSVIDLNNSKLVDLDLVNPETNVAPLGVLPEQMSASSDGCRIVTANRGSCDLTMVDVGTLMTPELGVESKLPASTIGSPTEPATGPSTVAQQIVVRRVRNGVAAEPLRLNPQEVMFLPQDTSAISGTTNLCTRDRPHADPVGWNSTPADPHETQWKALVTYPTCDLVALVDLPSGEIVDSVKIIPDGASIAFQSLGSDPDCPVEDFCDGRTAPAVAGPDGGAADGSASDGTASGGGSSSGAAASTDPFVNPTGTRPSSLAILPTGDRVYVGLTQAAFVAALDVRPRQLVIPDTGGRIKLHENALGVNAVRLSVDPFRRDRSAPPGQLGAFVGNDTRNIHPQYLYVVARDGTVRVVDVSPRNQLLPETECDVNVDPRFVPAQSGDPLVPDRTNICWPTEPPDLAHRRPLARGPGITLPSIPRDVAFAQLETDNSQEAVLDGAYAFILTISGAVYEVNIAPTLRTEQVSSGGTIPSPLPEVQPLVNTPRDLNMITFTSSLDPSAGPARLDLPPTVPALGPQISGINTSSPDDNATILQSGLTAVTTYVFFPQQVCSRSTPNPDPGCDSALSMIQPQRQTWNITWEGDLFGPSFSGQLTVFDSKANAYVPLTLKDQGVDFCQAGALPGDIVTLFGCTVDSQCGPAQVCRRSTTAPETADALPINGLCVPDNNDPTGQASELNDCAVFLNSLRRYEIVGAKSQSGTSTLTLQPEVDEITSESLTTCAGAPRPKAPSSPMANDGVAPTPCPPQGDDTRSTYACLAVDATGPLRCAKPCTTDSDCRSGRSCVLLPDAPQKICADAPPIPSSDAGQSLLHKCGLDQLTAYKVGAGSSFLVQGTAPAPFVPGMVDPTTFSCVPNPSRLDRIPYFQVVNGVRTPIPDCPSAFGPIETNQSPDQIGAALLRAIHLTPNPNPCLIRSKTTMPGDGGMATDGGDGGMQGNGEMVKIGPPFRVLFQNRELRFILGKFEDFAGNADLVTFDVHGGFLPDQVVLPTTIDINVPTRIVVGPIDSQTQVADLGPTSELPYLFVIDQRRLGSAAAGVGATRGQVLRINPRRATTTNTSSLVPIYDDPLSTANLWPIQ
jgi:hypothetical protein